jgi:hypothetical protein
MIDFATINESITSSIGSSYRFMIGATSNLFLLELSFAGSNRACQKQANATGIPRELFGLLIDSKMPRARKSASSEVQTRRVFRPRPARFKR